MKSTVTICPLTDELIPVFSTLFERLIRTAFPEYTPAARESMLHNERGWPRENWPKYSRDYYRTYGAYQKDRLVAILMGSVGVGGSSFVLWLMVDEPFRNSGVGSALLSTFEDEMVRLGVHMVHLYCKDENVGYYEKQGYKKVGRVERAWFELDANIMVKHVGEPDESRYLQDGFGKREMSS